MNKLILLTVSIMFLSSNMIAQGEWELRKEVDGIMAYTRDVEGIKFDEFLVETELNATLSQIMAIFKDFERYPELFPGTEGIKVLHDEPAHHITYIKFDIPFPARDRDAVFDNHLSFDKSKKMLEVDVKCDPGTMELGTGLVRITFCEGFWQFTDNGDGTVAVRHQLLVNPGGMAPAWIVNAKTVNDPIKTLKTLREFVKEDKYKNKSYELLNVE